MKDFRLRLDEQLLLPAAHGGSPSQHDPANPPSKTDSGRITANPSVAAETGVISGLATTHSRSVERGAPLCREFESPYAATSNG